MLNKNKIPLVEFEHELPDSNIYIYFCKDRETLNKVTIGECKNEFDYNQLPCWVWVVNDPQIGDYDKDEHYLYHVNDLKRHLQSLLDCIDNLV